jgi:catechol 2,3-dioxygenase-like lactoylglutathione lyase family enzyme
MDVVARGRKVVDVLERSYREAEEFGGRPERVEAGVPEPTDVDVRAAQQAAAELVALGLTGGSWEPWLRISWFPYLRQFPGYDRSVAKGWEVTKQMSRFALDGDTGRAFVTAKFNAEGRLIGMADSRREKEDGEPPTSVTIACPPDNWQEMKTFYRSLLGMDLPCREAGDPYLPPRWPDPKYPQQMHLDIFVADLDASEQIALAAGGAKLQDMGTYRIYADPLGHPLCLYSDASGRALVASSGGPVMARIVIDCPDPAKLASFYGQLLRMPQHIETSADRIVIARDARTYPMLAFQRVDDYLAPRWPDPAFPAQMHFDVTFDDRAAAATLATGLGATWIPPRDDEHFGHVYADPAGHPFCLLEPGD